MIDLGKKNLLGVGVNAIDYRAALDRLLRSAREGSRCATTALAVHGLMTGALDPVHRSRLNTFEIVTADGQPVRWALNLLYGANLTDRVYGPKLTLLLCEAAAKEGLPVYFYGSTAETLAHLGERLSRQFPGLQIAGMEPSRFRRLSAGEQAETVERIERSGARVLFVGLGCPRQEVFTYEVSRYLNMPVLAVGAAFDYHAGLLKEPPMLLQRFGLQWLYRLCQEPRRLWRRYVVTNTQFVLLLIAQWLRFWRPPLTQQIAIEDLRFG